MMKLLGHTRHQCDLDISSHHLHHDQEITLSLKNRAKGEED
jgi:hypothetical protein